MNIIIKRFISWLLLLFPFFGCSNALSAVYNETITRDQLNGKWVIITYWADWCDNCRAEISQLNKFYLKHKNVILLGVNFDNLPLDQLNADIIRNNILYPVLKSNPADSLKLGTVEVLPTTFVISPQGKIVYKLIGSQSAEALDKIVSQANDHQM